MSKPLVIYHDNCADGFCAAQVARLALQDANFHPAQYGDLPPDVFGRNVYVLDFSYPREVLIEMEARASSLRVLDHHKTAAAALDGLPFCVFDMNRSGARLAWDHFFPGKPSPWIVDYVEDRDLWRWALPGSKSVSAALASYPRTFESWDGAMIAGRDAAEKQGAAILRYQDQLVEAICKNAAEREIDGHRVLLVNSPVLQSEVGERLAFDRAFSVVWFERADGKIVNSLRSRPPHGIDVSEIAKKHGGGGHAAAAGFTSDALSAANARVERLEMALKDLRDATRWARVRDEHVARLIVAKANADAALGVHEDEGKCAVADCENAADPRWFVHVLGKALPACDGHGCAPGDPCIGCMAESLAPRKEGNRE